MIGAPPPQFEIPPPVSRILERALVAEYAYFTPRGEPLCWPVTPYWYPERGVLAVATGVAYPAKATYARLEPRVGMLFSRGEPAAPDVVVQGRAFVLDRDIQANTDRYVRELRAKFPVARLGLNALSVKLLGFYLPRLWVEITPARVVVRGPGGPPRILGGLPPDPGPPAAGRSEPCEARLGRDEARALARWVGRTGEGVVAVRGEGGFPDLIRTTAEWAGGSSVRLARAPGEGPAALTFHVHGLAGARLDAVMARGRVEAAGDGFVFRARRVVGFLGAEAAARGAFFSVFPLSQIPQVPVLRRRLRRELARRGQPMPKLRVLEEGRTAAGGPPE